MKRSVFLAGALAIVWSQIGCQQPAEGPVDLGPADLPQAGEILTIDRARTLVIADGEVGALAGTIAVEPTGSLTLAVDGELTVDDEALISMQSGSVDWTLRGALLGMGLQVDISAGGEFDFDAHEGMIEMFRFKITNRTGRFSWLSSGADIDDLLVENYGAVAEITDTGQLRFNYLYLKDQSDDVGSTGITLACADVEDSGQFMVVSNGSDGAVNVTMSGDVAMEGIDLDINYGGQVDMNVAAGANVAVTDFAVDCSGASHGNQSGGELVNDGYMAATNVMFGSGDNCEHRNVTEAGGPETWQMTFNGENTFSIIDRGTLNMVLAYE